MHLTQNWYHTIFENMLCLKHVVMSNFVKIKTKKSQKSVYSNCLKVSEIYLGPSKTSLMELFYKKPTLLRANQTHKIPRKSLSKKALAQNYSNLILRIQE